jgi:thiosulfate reductase/polysulfide reductase chain A
MSELSRRHFIKLGGAGAGAMAFSGFGTNWWGLDANSIHDPATDGDRIVPTFCELCFWKCGVLAHVKDGQVTKIVVEHLEPVNVHEHDR